ncbi:prolipoprotein diacylglyceryl transferase [Mucilaginibacter sp. UYCu711]|uniref:prolipoprotein diacylglyceryl transferase n=1 Tax=Mucilaginibacter sp. UYCu711 TaxID=3156339 RepID=UPI003D1CEE07
MIKHWQALTRKYDYIETVKQICYREMNQSAFIIWNPDPNLFNIGFLALKWYSLLFLAGFVISYQLLKSHFKRHHIDHHLLDRLTIYVAVGTIAGARLGHCLFYDFDYYSHHIAEVFLPFTFSPQFKFTGYQGLASHGGAIGILLAIFFFSRKYCVKYLWVADQLALVVPIAGCCIRLGNLINSEIIGKPSQVPWAFIFVQKDNLPRHPAQLYEALAYLAIFFVVNAFATRPGSKPGFVFGLFLILLFSARFYLEALKENQSAFEDHWLLNLGQLLSLPFMLLGLILIILCYSKQVRGERF